jgi:flagellar protein FliS
MTNKEVAGYKNIFAETSVGIARPENLILLVFEKLLDHLLSAEKQMQAGELAIEPLDKALDIFKVGLIPALDFEKGGEIAKNLASLYDWSIRHLLKARINKDPAMVNEVREVLMPIYEAWQGVVSERVTS